MTYDIMYDINFRYSERVTSHTLYHVEFFRMTYDIIHYIVSTFSDEVRYHTLYHVEIFRREKIAYMISTPYFHRDMRQHI